MKIQLLLISAILICGCTSTDTITSQNSRLTYENIMREVNIEIMGVQPTNYIEINEEDMKNWSLKNVTGLSWRYGESGSIAVAIIELEKNDPRAEGEVIEKFMEPICREQNCTFESKVIAGQPVKDFSKFIPNLWYGAAYFWSKDNFVFFVAQITEPEQNHNYAEELAAKIIGLY
jgi:hypothetical protein